MANKQPFKVGDLVRMAGRTTTGACGHGFKHGQVVEVLDVDAWGNPGCPSIKVRGAGVLDQLVMWNHPMRLAKQAMRKRDEYLNRRG